jgi:hypothetical protein
MIEFERIGDGDVRFQRHGSGVQKGAKGGSFGVFPTEHSKAPAGHAVSDADASSWN